MDLVLWRHAQAADLTPSVGDDMARSLTSHGKRQAEAIGAWLHQHLPKNARIVTSPARRAIETAHGLPRVHEVVERLAPHLGTVQTVLDVAGWTTPGAASLSDTVVVVGHQPTLGMVAAHLLCGQAQSWSVKKGAVWWLRSRPRGGCELWMVQAPLVQGRDA